MNTFLINFKCNKFSLFKLIYKSIELFKNSFIILKPFVYLNQIILLKLEMIIKSNHN